MLNDPQFSPQTLLLCEGCWKTAVLRNMTIKTVIMDLVDDCRLCGFRPQLMWDIELKCHTHTHRDTAELCGSGVSGSGGACGTLSTFLRLRPQRPVATQTPPSWEQRDAAATDTRTAEKTRERSRGVAKPRVTKGWSFREGVSCWCGLTGVRRILMSSFLCEHRVREFDKRPPDGRGRPALTRMRSAFLRTKSLCWAAGRPAQTASDLLSNPDQ